MNASKITISLLVSVGFFLDTVNAQINLIATGLDTITSKVDITRWTALDSTTISETSSNLDTYLLGSSVFDANANTYYFRGTDTFMNGLTNFQLASAAFNLFPSDGVYNGGTQISMSTGKVYSLAPDTTGTQFAIYECNLLTNTNVQIGSINEQITLPVISESTCFDSNNGYFYFIAYDSNAVLHLYRVAIVGSGITLTKVAIPNGTANYFIQKLHYDNTYNKIYAMAVETNIVSSAITGHIISIDMLSGNITTLQSFSDYVVYQNGTSNFDQITGTFIFVGLDSNYEGEMVLYNTVSNTMQKGFVPYGAHNIECDNYKFAKIKYAPASLLNREQNQLFTLYPNPVTDYLFVDLKDNTQPAQWSIMNLQGQLLKRSNMEIGKTSIYTKDLSPGNYFIRIQQNNSFQTIRMIVE